MLVADKLKFTKKIRKPYNIIRNYSILGSKKQINLLKLTLKKSLFFRNRQCQIIEFVVYSLVKETIFLKSHVSMRFFILS